MAPAKRIFMRIAVLSLLFTLPALPVLAAPEKPIAHSAQETDPRIAELIQQLGHREYVQRDRAQRELSRLGLEAFEALYEAKESRDPEIAAQARYLVRQIRFDWIRPTDPAELRDILKDYEGQSAEARTAKVGQIAALAERPALALPSLEWLCRLARFEESELLSKEAAIKAMQQAVPANPKAADEHFQTIANAIARGTRPAALWLKNYVLEASDPTQAADEWQKLIAAEERQLDKPSETSPQLISTLLRRQVGLLDRLNRPDDALQAISHLVQLERGDTASLLSLIDWLRERKAWPVLDEVSVRFDGGIANEALLLYALAQARAEQGESKLAEELAKRAFELSPNSPEEHFGIAAALQERGLNAWSDREYRYLIEKLPPVNRGTIVARLRLSEDLHDRGREAEAAEVLKPMADALAMGNGDLQRLLDSMDRPPAGIRSRMHYFEAKAAQGRDDMQAYRKLLEQGVAADPTDADVLIALFRLPDQTDQEKQRTKELIEKAATASRQMLEEFPDDPTAYNQLAWLIGNTEGDFDEAIRLSLKSIELKHVGGYLDTLAHCYFANKDYANAVTTQEAAAKLEPHSHLIRKQLQVFKNALARQQQQAGEQPAPKP
jgi:Flp pilus assembly protein TadD